MSRAVKVWAALGLLAWIGMAAAKVPSTPEIEATARWLTAQTNSSFAQYMEAFLGDPFKAFFGPASAVAKSGIYMIWVLMAQAVAVLGYTLRVASLRNGGGNTLNEFWTATITFATTLSLMMWMYVPGSYGLKNVITSSATVSYMFSVETFGGKVDAKLKESEEAFTRMLASTAVVATSVALPGAGGAAINGTKIAASAVRSGATRMGAAAAGAKAAAPGLQKAGMGFMGNIVKRLGGAMTALNTFLAGYGVLLEGAGWGITIILVGLPMALALLNFGQTSVIFVMFGTWMGTLAALMLMPLVLVHAIDTAFVGPVRAMDTYTEKLGLYAQKSKDLADESAAKVNTEIDKVLVQCEQARAKDAANVDSNACTQITEQGLIDKIGGWMGGYLKSMINGAELLLASVADTFISFGVLVIRLMVGLVLAGALMFGVPAMAITMFGGVGLRK